MLPVSNSTAYGVVTNAPTAVAANTAPTLSNEKYFKKIRTIIIESITLHKELTYSEPHTIPISKFIDSGISFFIPSYQRGYRWGSVEILRLLADINNFDPVQDGEFYCLQPVVVRFDKSNNYWRLIDGQQRLTTIFLILSTWEKSPSIGFDNHDMTKSGLNETLYIKMNSRGKHLNPFEQIKSAFDALVSNKTECYDVSVYDTYPWDISHKGMSFAKKWSYCMDREWGNWFWNEQTASLDGTLLKVILSYTYIFLICRGDHHELTDSYIERRKEETISLIKNTIEDSDTLVNFSRNCKRYYSQGSTHMLVWLNSQYAELPQKHSEQLDEEIYKASMPLLSVKQAASHILLKGRIRPLLLDENGNLSSTKFEDRYNNFKAMFNNEGDVIDQAQFIRDYILCADTQNAMSYYYDSKWSIFRTSANAIKNKLNDHVYDTVWPYLFSSP
ncbi:MAG: DUF262 domain-containing protein, partial [Muribaculaceae bacterium]|nr:DUF262 domain-containing protein [Muribaculaceae bacterium]